MELKNRKGIVSKILNQFGIGVSKNQLTDIISVEGRLNQPQIQLFIDELNDEDKTRSYLKALERDDNSSELRELIQQAYEGGWRSPSDDEGFSLCYDLLSDRVRDRRRSYFAPYLQGANSETQILYEWLRTHSQENRKRSLGDYYNNIFWLEKILLGGQYEEKSDTAINLDTYINKKVSEGKSEYQDSKSAIKSMESGNIIRLTVNAISHQLQSITKHTEITPEYIASYNTLCIFLYGEECFKRVVLLNPTAKKREGVDIPSDLRIDS